MPKPGFKWLPRSGRVTLRNVDVRKHICTCYTCGWASTHILWYLYKVIHQLAIRLTLKFMIVCHMIRLQGSHFKTEMYRHRPDLEHCHMLHSFNMLTNDDLPFDNRWCILSAWTSETFVFNYKTNNDFKVTSVIFA